MAALDEIQAAVARVAEGARSGVVRIDSGWRGASGIVVGDGLVLTNAHNVHGQTVGVSLADGAAVEGSVVGRDGDGDLAVIALKTPGAAAPAWAPEGTIGIGLPVFAAAATSDGVRVTWGLVSSVSRAFRGPRGRRISGSLEHTAPMAPGSSGSALLDAQGRLVGLNTNRIGGGFYLALPADAALRARVDALAQGREPTRPRLGVALAPAWAARRMRRAVGLAERDGLLVRDVDADSPAARAGLTVGDLIVVAAGRSMASADDLYEVLGTVAAEGTLEVGIVRGADEQTLQVSFGAS
jgi:S1-C subfamily serine protease